MNPFQMPNYGQAILQDQDLIYTALADQKRVCREYTTAVTESNCKVVRQAFSTLLHESLQMQAELYYLMQNQNMYNVSSQAPQEEIRKQVQQYTQIQQKTRQLLHQNQHPMHVPSMQHERQGQFV